jgi:solute carrier family 6 amino acid/orphan transporter-like 15/16/17/18/20
MIGSRPSYFWLLCWRFVGPIAMVIIFVASLIEIFSKGVSYEVWNSLKVRCLSFHTDI